jgi:(p)ppGpp synthase/HD superfamily hydrolase
MTQNDLQPLFAALSFAAEKHRDQRRKDRDASPYINHPIALADLLVSHGVTDLAVLQAALLHDTIEDTETTPDEIEARFGADVRALVEAVTDDKRLPKPLRKQLQVDHAASLSDGAKLIKLADKICNVADIARAPPANWDLQRRREYLAWADDVVAGCRGVHAALEAQFDRVLADARAHLSRHRSDDS